MEKIVWELSRLEAIEILLKHNLSIMDKSYMGDILMDGFPGYDNLSIHELECELVDAGIASSMQEVSVYERLSSREWREALRDNREED